MKKCEIGRYLLTWRVSGMGWLKKPQMVQYSGTYLTLRTAAH